MIALHLAWLVMEWCAQSDGLFVCCQLDPMFRGVYHGSTKHRGLAAAWSLYKVSKYEI